MGDMRECWFCHRDIEDALTQTFDFGPGYGLRTVCHDCIDKADEGCEDMEDEDAA